MIEQVGKPIKFIGFFSANRQGRGGLIVAVDIYDPEGTQILSGALANEIGGGLYCYTLAGSRVVMPGEYLAIFKTINDEVDQLHIPALWVVGRAGIEKLNNLNIPVSAIIDKLNTMNTLGEGATPFTYYLMLPDGKTPIADADIWITSDQEGFNIIASAQTDWTGKATFYLSPGTIYIWRSKPGFSFINPDKEVIQ